MVNNNLVDGSIRTIRNFEFYDDKVNYQVKRIEIFRPAHRTACDVADISIKYEIVVDVGNEVRSKVYKAVEDFIVKERKDNDYPNELLVRKKKENETVTEV